MNVLKSLNNLGLRGERTTIHVNLCFCLLLAEILLLSGLDATENAGVCGTIAGFLHFLFLAAFAWMFVEGVHVYFMLVKVRKASGQTMNKQSLLPSRKITLGTRVPTRC